MSAKKPAPRSLGECEVGDVVQLANGTVKLTGKLQHGWMVRDWSRSGAPGFPRVVVFETAVIKLIENGQQRYRPSSVEDNDPLRGVR